jgi:hypothetical protein
MSGRRTGTVTTIEKRRPLATPQQVSEYLQIPVATLKDWRVSGRGPRYRKVGHAVRYLWADIDAYVESAS